MHIIAIIVNRLTRMVPCYTCLRTCFMPKATCSEKPHLIFHLQLLALSFWSSPSDLQRSRIVFLLLVDHSNQAHQQ
jgi:hypothetical protein